MLIGVNGAIGSGKSTFANLLSAALNEEGIMAEERFFAKPLKQICEILFGYGGYTQEEKNIYLEDWEMTVGEALQVIGTDVMRNNFHKEVWVKAATKCMDVGTVYIFSDVRFPNEAEAVKNKGGLLIKLVGDPAKVRVNSKRDLGHQSETALDNYKNFDYIFDNTGPISALKDFSKKIVGRIVKI